MPIMQSKEKSSYQTEDEKAREWLEILKDSEESEGMPDATLNASYQAYRSYHLSRADKAFTPHPPVQAD
ncbi:hypothetical protein HT118_25990 [Escherichia coli]|nr:hypothetical protein [Escherichia coli]